MNWFDGAANNGALNPRIEELLVACVESVTVDGGGMSLVSRQGRAEPLYGSDPTAQTIERLQFTLGEGPCLDAANDRSPVLVPDLRTPGPRVSGRWPAFLAEAGHLGVRAVFAFPLNIGARSLGAVDLYRTSPGALQRGDLAKSLAVADAIAYALVDGVDGVDGVDAEVGALADLSFDPRPLSSMEIHRAAGMVMVQIGSSIEEALVRLRATAYAEEMPVDDLARAVVRGERRFEGEWE